MKNNKRKKKKLLINILMGKKTFQIIKKRKNKNKIVFDKLLIKNLSI